MIFGELTLHNFLSFKKAKIDLSEPGIFIVTGDVIGQYGFDSNGAGKSSLFEAIVWVLFGRTIKDASKDEVVREGKTNCYVKLEIIDGDNKYIVERYRKHEKYKNSIRLIVNGNDSSLDIKETQELINSLLGIDFKSFTNSIIFGQGITSRFSSASDRERKEILDSILDLDYIRDSFSKVKLKIQSLISKRNELKNMLDKSKDLYKHNCERRDEIQERTNSYYIKKFERIIEKLEDIIKADNEAEELFGLLIPFNPEKDLEDLKIELNKYEEQSNKLFDSIDTSILSRYNEDKISIEKLKNKLDVLVIKRKELKLSSKCTECGQDINKRMRNEQKEKISLQIKKLKDDINIKQRRVSKNESIAIENNNISKQHEVIRSKIRNIESQMSDVKVNIVRRKDNISMLKKRIGSLNYDINEIRKLKGREEKTSGEDKVNSKIKLLEVQIKDYKEQIDNIDYEIEYLNFWKDGFSDKGIKSMIFKSIVPFLNKQANKYADILTGGNLRIEFNNKRKLKKGDERDKLDVKVYKIKGGKNYKLASGGEKRRADVCQLLALRDLVLSRGNKSINFLCLDEVFESLDETGVEKTVELIGILSQQSTSVYVISHLQALRDHYNNRINIIHKNGISRIE